MCYVLDCRVVPKAFGTPRNDEVWRMDCHVVLKIFGTLRNDEVDGEWISTFKTSPLPLFLAACAGHSTKGGVRNDGVGDGFFLLSLA